MGLWDWLTGKPKRVTTCDRMWLTRAAKRRELCLEIQKHLAVAQPVVLLAHFPTTLAEIRQELTGAKIPHDVSTAQISARHISRFADGRPDRLIHLGLVKQLHSDPSSYRDVEEGGLIHLLIAERHFLRKHDESITDFAETLSIRSDVTFHLS